MNHEDNPHAPPSSAEEAAALLGASISSAEHSSPSSPSPSHPNPPPGMHSVFAVQSPAPGTTLFARLCNLRDWLRRHAADGREPFAAARSVLAVLMKLLEASSGAGSRAEGDDAAARGAGNRPDRKRRPFAPDGPTSRQHKALPPLLSTPLRNVWVDCVSLCVSLGSSLPGNQRTDVSAFLTEMADVAGRNPRSKAASGGVRLAALSAIRRICASSDEAAERSAPRAREMLARCHGGLMSGGAGEPGHRAECVAVARGLMVACRRAARGAPPGSGGGSFVAPGALEERAAAEAVRLLRRAAGDRYPEVRAGAAAFAGLAAPVLVRGAASPGRKDAEGASPLAWLEDATQVAMRNLDDESAGVATAWAASLARCLCASAEYGKSVRDAQSEDQANRRSADVDDEDAATDSNNLDFAGKFKAFSEARRAAAATSVCSSVTETVKFLVSHFIKCGGEGTSNKCGGSFSIGGRASRIGYSSALTEFLRLQAAKGDFPLGETLPMVLDMVGTSFEKQINRTELSRNSSSSEADLYAPSSPYSSPEKKSTSALSASFLNKNSKAKSSADSTIGRLLTSMVIRKGISENMSELSQLAVLREITVSCRMSVAPTAPDGSSDAVRPVNAEHGKILNRHQIQVALVEMSHLITALGEAGAASLEEIMPVLKDCLAHREHGVRLEAATVYAAVAQAFPTEGRKFVIESLSGFAANMDAIQALSMRVASEAPSTPKGRFRRGAQVKEDGTVGSRLKEELMQHKYYMHGNSLAVSMLMHEFPHVVGGIARVIVDKTFDVCEKLIQCQSNEAFVNANPSAVCTCIRAGYCMLSGIFTMGVDTVIPHVTSIFSLWQSSSMNVLPGVSKQSPSHDLLCVESMLSSVVSFLKFCPTLLLSVPDALNRITSLLEKIFPLLSSGGRFDNEGGTSIGSARLSNARSAVMEAYSWLPPGSFPLSADRIFTFAAKQIQELSGNEVICSILNSLVSREDDLIDAHSFERAVSPGQVGNSAALDHVISIRSCDIVTTYERETTLHLISWRKTSQGRIKSERHHESSILGLLLRESDDNSKPTPLHEVGTWKAPLDPIPTAKVRLLDSSIHVFAATFGLQDPHTQSDALRMLETLYFTAQTEKSNRFAVNTALITDSQGKVRPLEEDAITFNVTAVVLACLQAIPLHEATYGNLIGKGPPWMERATNLLLQLIPSPSDVIRRGAAEGLSYLATLGVSEDAHTLQSTILHALDEVMQGNNSVANQKTSTDFLSFGRAGSLSSLACIQRTSKRLEQTMKNRATSRSVSQTDSKQSENDAPPVLIMMTRLLPSLATHSPDLDSCLVRCHAIHAFGVLISNSFPDPKEPLSPEQIQIAWKAVEAIESSFLGAWSAVVLDNNKGREKEKFAWEPALVAAIFRLMTTLLPWLSYLMDVDRWIASRFSCYASSILECCTHPVVCFEGSVFFECLSAHQNLVHPSNCCVSRTDNTASMALPFLLSVISPCSASVVAESIEDSTICSSTMVQRSAVMCLSKLCSALDDFPLNVRSALFSFLHDVCGRRHFQHISDFRSLAQSHMSFDHFNDVQLLEDDVVRLIHAVLNTQASGRGSKQKSVLLLQWLLCCRCLVSGGPGKSGQQEDPDSVISPIDRIISQFRTLAQSEASRALCSSSPSRWQLKCVAGNIAFVALTKLVDMDKGNSIDTSMFNLTWAKSQCNVVLKKGNAEELVPLPAFYMEELVLTACSAAAATSNHSELLSVQIGGIRLLTALFGAFGNMIENDGAPVLEQFSSQIISAVKHSLKSELPSEESTPSGFHLLFSAGCDALLALIKNGFISDPVALKRMLKPVMLSEDYSVFVKYPTEQSVEFNSLVTSPHCVTDDLPSYPSFRLSKLCFAATLYLIIAYGEINQNAAATITQETEKGEEVRAIHSAAAAIDGYLLTTGCKNISGLTFKNRADLDDGVIQGLVENWSTLCASALASLIKAIKATDKNSDKIKSLREWLENLSSISFSGLKTSLSGSSPSKTTSQHASSCIYAIRLLIRDSACIGDNILCPSELSDVLEIVTKSVIFPALGLLENKSYTKNIDPQLLKQSCGLFEDISRHNSIFDSSSPILHRAIVQPLASYQEGKFTLEGVNDEIVSSCVRSSISLMRSSSRNERVSLEKALLQFTIHTLIKLNPNDNKTQAEAECLSLLQACLENTVLSQKEWSQMTSFTAANELWGAWYVLACALPAGVGIEHSIISFKKSLGNLSTSAQHHVKALDVFRNGLQTAMGEKPALVRTVLHTLGFELFQLFRFYSMNMSSESDIADSRLLLCAECVKVILMAYQYLASVSTDESKFVGFLVTLFTLLVESISFNGLPNHPSGKHGADDKIGKMCAQVFVHIARTTPPMFKSTMTVVVPECRYTVEAAVRADMSGYAAAAQGPAKKKLSLKGFVK